MGLLSILSGRTAKQKPQSVFSTQATSGSRYQTPATGLQMREVRVTEIVRETPGAISIFFEPVHGQPLRYQAGQFLTFVVTIDGQEYRRAYSFSSAPHEARPSVTVKRVDGGLVSGYFNDNLKAGNILRVMGPSGEFTVAELKGEQAAAPRYIFVAGGSGITPLISLTKSLLHRDAQTDITLLYGNRAPGDVIFAGALDVLAQSATRFHVRYVFENHPSEWAGESGRLTGDKVVALSEPANAHYYICGPEPMMDGVVAALQAAGVAAARIKTERFSAPARRTQDRPAQSHAVRFTRTGATVTPQPGQTLLEAGLAAGVPLNYSCAMGGCAACKVRIVSGNAVMDEPNCLSAAERSQGYVLACVACAATPLEVEA